MATFDVCSSPAVIAGGSFQWSNLNRQWGVKVTPVTTWPLPQSEYDIAAGATTAAITIPSTTPKNTNYFYAVHWQSAINPGQPCSTVGGNPKIIVGDTVPGPSPKHR